MTKCKERGEGNLGTGKTQQVIGVGGSGLRWDSRYSAGGKKRGQDYKVRFPGEGSKSGGEPKTRKKDVITNRSGT